MKKSQGSQDALLVECINSRLQKYRVRWNYQPYIDREGKEQGVTFMEEEFNHKPNLEEVKEVILGWMNSEIDYNILCGFKWNDIKVWLSTENQFNYKAAYDLAVQTNGANLPITFKFGNNEDPEYHTFELLTELQDFYMKAMEYINVTLNSGWAEKDAFDWAPYENLLAND